jgi:hypothetical protein
MSIFSGIANAEHTFVAWLENELAIIEKDAPKIEAYVENGATYAVATLKIVLAQVEPGSAAANAITLAIQKILTASAVVFDAGASPTVATLFQDVVSNLSGIESLAAVGGRCGDGD